MYQLQLNVLLDLSLKSDEIIELLEDLDLSVVYDFDRLNEGSKDNYWVPAQAAGFQLRFNQNQVLKTVFAYVAAKDGFSAVDSSIVGVPFYSSREEAQHAFEDAGIPFTTGHPTYQWVKGQFPEYSAHYEFGQSGALTLVTLMAIDA